ncbi:response regulator transcription factor, partial [Streptococcus suis]
WALLQQDEAPRLVILDWILSGLNGTDLCREIRTKCVDKYTYVLMVTSHGEPADVVRGLEAGADDYLIKPYNPLELRARLAAGRRVLEHQERLLG